VHKENGPYRIEKNLTLSLNPYSWNSFANIIYVDAPVGTGYSYPDSILGYPTDEAQIAEVCVPKLTPKISSDSLAGIVHIHAEFSCAVSKV